MKTTPTRRQRAALAEQRTLASILRDWRERSVARAERKRAKALRKRRKAGLSAAQRRIPAQIADAPTIRTEVVCQGGQAINPDKGRTLSGRRRVRARKAARREYLADV